MIFIPASEFGKSVADGLPNLTEVSVAEVVEEFLEGTAYLEPRMSPGVGALDVLLEGEVFNDMGRMAQGELECVALHGVHAAQTLGYGVEVG